MLVTREVFIFRLVPRIVDETLQFLSAFNISVTVAN